jgi:hypothetical protein
LTEEPRHADDANDDDDDAVDDVDVDNVADVDTMSADGYGLADLPDTVVGVEDDDEGTG